MTSLVLILESAIYNHPSVEHTIVVSTEHISKCRTVHERVTSKVLRAEVGKTEWRLLGIRCSVLWSGKYTLPWQCCWEACSADR